MKKYFFLAFLSFACKLSFAQGYQVTLQAPAYKTGIAYLTYYMGSSFNIQDSAAVTNTGTAIFKGPQKLNPGIYALFLPGKASRVEFLVDKEQMITVKVIDPADLINKTVVTGSKENILYQEYQRFITPRGAQREQERKAYSAAHTKQDSALHEQKYNTISAEINNYRTGIIKTRPTSMMAALLNAMKDPAVLTETPVTHEDSLKNFNYYKAHYWDGVSFMDDRIIRTPFFLPKLERYYREVVVAADDVIKDVDYKLLLARNSPEMYKFLLNWLTDEFINPKYMGQDAVFVHLFENYHSKGFSPWLNEKQMETISRRAYMQMSNLVGEKAANLEMIDKDGNPTSLYNVAADYTLVCFWDPNCGHCKEEIPRIDSIYKANWKKYNMKIYAVLSPDGKDGEALKPEWQKFIDTHNLTDGWIHVYQTLKMQTDELAAQKPGYRQLYDVVMTPTIYLLDKDKRIIGKKLTILQLNDLLEIKATTKKPN
jgi:thiol-disulfide isomerase/thioredoxin